MGLISRRDDCCSGLEAVSLAAVREREMKPTAIGDLPALPLQVNNHVIRSLVWADIQPDSVLTQHGPSDFETEKLVQEIQPYLLRFLVETEQKTACLAICEKYPWLGNDYPPVALTSLQLQLNEESLGLGVRRSRRD